MRIRKKEFLKIISFIIVFAICITSLSTMIFATTNVNQFDGGTSPLAAPIKEIMGKGLRVVQKVAGGVALIVLLILGLKLVTSGPEGRAASKKAFVIYVVGFMITISGVKIIESIASLIQ